MGSNGGQSTEGPPGTVEHPAGEQAASSFSVGRDPPTPPDVEAETRLVETVAPELEDDRHPIIRVAVEDAAVVEHVTGTLADEPSIVATSVGHVVGPDSRSAFDVVLAREHDPQLVAGAIAAIDGVRGASATRPSTDESSNGRAVTGSAVPAGLDHTFAELKSDVDRESYDTVVAELEAVDFVGADGTDVSLDGLLADEETSPGAPTADAGVDPGEATGDPLDPLLDSLVAALEDVDLSAAQRDRVRRAVGLEGDGGTELDRDGRDAGTEAGRDAGDARTEARVEQGDRDLRESPGDLVGLASALGEVLEAVAVDTHDGDRLDELEERVAGTEGTLDSVVARSRDTASRLGDLEARVDDVETEVEIFSTVRNQIGTLPDAGSAP